MAVWRQSLADSGQAEPSEDINRAPGPAQAGPVILGIHGDQNVETIDFDPGNTSPAFRTISEHDDRARGNGG